MVLFCASALSRKRCRLGLSKNDVIWYSIVFWYAGIPQNLVATLCPIPDCPTFVKGFNCRMKSLKPTVAEPRMAPVMAAKNHQIPFATEILAAA